MTGPNNLREAAKTNELPMTVLSSSGLLQKTPHTPPTCCVCLRGV